MWKADTLFSDLLQALSAISLGDASLALPPLGGMPMPQMGMGPGTSGLMRPQGALTMAPTIPVNYQPAVLSSITLRGEKGVGQGIRDSS